MSEGGRERRKHDRYVVEGLVVHLGPEIVDIVDISAEAVRLVRPQAPIIAGEAVAFHIRNNQWGEPADVPLAGRLIRSGNGFIVLGYQMPFAEWDQFLCRHDTFERVALGPIAI